MNTPNFPKCSAIRKHEEILQTKIKDLQDKVRNGKVEDVKLKISENKRFYTQAVRRRHYSSIPQFVSRICGTCSIAHLTCSIKAVENALTFNHQNKLKS